MPKWCPAKVVRKRVWCDGLFTLEIEAPAVLPFEPGQFLHLALEVNGELVNRPYSVASPHGGELAFYIVKVDDGKLTPSLWNLQEGDALQVSEKAAGGFTLAKTPAAENLWMIGTGTGLAPYIAMLQTDLPWEKFHRVIVVHGVRHTRELGYSDWIHALAQRHAERLVYIPSATRDQADGVLSGRTTDLLSQGVLEQVAGCQIRPDNSAFLLCGNPAMLDDMEASLGQRGLTRHRAKSPGHIVVERYW
ncbi:MAG TPA: ferredoxin--NADP reductase [Pirellulaceae bacterium]|nr:ferredoxin--NADP reductase [Pirellulaceae bacterium]